MLIRLTTWPRVHFWRLFLRMPNLALGDSIDLRIVREVNCSGRWDDER